MQDELNRVGAYVYAVFRHWWVLTIEVVLVLTDMVERAFGIWLLPPLWAKVTIGVGVLVVAQYLAYRELHGQLLERQKSIALNVQEKWRPSARLESEPPNNFLILKSDREFKIERIALVTSNGATVAEIQQKDFAVLRSTGYRVSLPSDKVGEWWRYSSRLGSPGKARGGSISVEVSREDDAASFSLPFVAEQEFYGGTLGWIKLTG